MPLAGAFPRALPPKPPLPTVRPASSAAPDAPPSEDHDAQPLVRIPPSGFEACFDDAPAQVVVDLVFDVNEDGRTQNVRVLNSNDPCFDRHVIRAIEKWRYAPKVVEGIPVPRTGVRSSITFEIGA